MTRTTVPRTGSSDVWGIIAATAGERDEEGVHESDEAVGELDDVVVLVAVEDREPLADKPLSKHCSARDHDDEQETRGDVRDQTPAHCGCNRSRLDDVIP